MFKQSKTEIFTIWKVFVTWLNHLEKLSTTYFTTCSLKTLNSFQRKRAKKTTN